MRRGGGKQKGSAFERDVCRRLSLWLSDGKREDCLWRSAMSGGRSTIAARKGKRLTAQAGDITATHEIGLRLTSQFLIECKAYRDLDFIGLLKVRGNLVNFWAKVKKEALHYKREPMLIAKQNQQPIMVCLRAENSLGLESPVVSVPGIDLDIFMFDNFLAQAVVPDAMAVDK